MRFFNKLRDCLFIIKRVWKEDEENRKLMCDIFNKIHTAADKDLCIDSLDWLHNAVDAVVISRDAMGEYSYDSNDDEYDIDFRNQCKNIIQENLFNFVGQEKYQEQLDIFEPDVYMAFKEIKYYEAKAAYYERLTEYIKAMNDPMGLKSNMLSRLWDDVCEFEKVYKSAEANLNS